MKPIKLILILMFISAMYMVNATDFNISKLNNAALYTQPTGLEPGELNKELVTQFCYQVQKGLVWMVGIAMLLWIMEPAIKKKLSNLEDPDNSAFANYLVSDGAVPFFIKWIGLGLLFMVGYSLWMLM